MIGEHGMAIGACGFSTPMIRPRKNIVPRGLRHPRRERQLEGSTVAKACKPSIETLPGFRDAEANSVTQHRPSKLSGGSRMRTSVRPKRGAPRYTRADIVLGAVNSAVTL
jgi:hypothetical protein